MTQNGVQLGAVIQGVTYGHCGLDSGRLCIRGNWQNPNITSPSAQNPSFVLALGIPSGSANPTIDRGMVDIAVETDISGSGDNMPSTIVFNNSSSSILNCFGRLVFTDGWTSSNATYGQLSFGGPIVAESQLLKVNAAPNGWSPAAAPQNFKPADGTGTSSTSLVMLGLGSTMQYIPQSSGTVLIVAQGSGYNNSTGGFQVSGRYGTGTPPGNGASATGTQWGGTPPNYGNLGSNVVASWTMTDVITGLTPGQTYWIDIALAALTAGTANAHKVSLSIMETS